MRFEEVLQKKWIKDIPDQTVIGIDIGSRQAKAVLLHQGNLYTALVPTGFFMQKTADTLIGLLIEKAQISEKEITYIVVTGYGRIALHFEKMRYRTVTEIACHGKGAHYLGENVHTIVDIGGQDSKAIRINPEDGSVVDFAMNDKCAAGTGTFLERISAVLGLDVTEIGETSLKADEPVKIDSTCVVFAESEVVSNRAKGTSVENIAAGIHKAVANRVNGLLSRVGIESNVLFTGGVSNNIGMKTALEKILGVKITESKLDTVFAGALGAAVFAAEFAQKNLPSEKIKELKSGDTFSLDLSGFRKTVNEAKNAFINKTAGTKAYVGYTCVYTPIEILAAANVSFIRFLHKGTPDEVIAGETLSQSMLCDYIKSIVGSFIKKEPEAMAVEKLYTFYTCTCMRSAVESIGQLYVPSAVFHVPRKHNEAGSKEVLAAEIQAFKRDLEELTGETITEEAIYEKTKLYNRARRYMCEIAEFRKGNAPLIHSSEYQELVIGFFQTPVEKLLPELEAIKQQLEKADRPAEKKIRLLLTGGIVTQGDQKITKILEDMDVEIVAEDNCTGIKPLSFEVKEEKDEIYFALADAYLGKAPCSRMYTKEDMLEYSRKLAKEYDVDGVVFYYLKFCPSYNVEEKIYQDLFREENIPLIVLSGDYSMGDEGQIKTRLEAFIELIQQKNI